MILDSVEFRLVCTYDTAMMAASLFKGIRIYEIVGSDATILVRFNNVTKKTVDDAFDAVYAYIAKLDDIQPL